MCGMDSFEIRAGKNVFEERWRADPSTALRVCDITCVLNNRRCNKVSIRFKLLLIDYLCTYPHSFPSTIYEHIFFCCSEYSGSKTHLDFLEGLCPSVIRHIRAVTAVRLQFTFLLLVLLVVRSDCVRWLARFHAVTHFHRGIAVATRSSYWRRFFRCFLKLK